MFNVYLPKMLEMNSGASDTVPKTLEDTMWQVVIFTLAGCPGAIVSRFNSVFSLNLKVCVSTQIGAYMVESSFGRRWSLASSTFVTAAFCVLFIYSESAFAVLVSTADVSFSSTVSTCFLFDALILSSTDNVGGTLWVSYSTNAAHISSDGLPRYLARKVLWFLQ